MFQESKASSSLRLIQQLFNLVNDQILEKPEGFLSDVQLQQELELKIQMFLLVKSMKMFLSVQTESEVNVLNLIVLEDKTAALPPSVCL